MKKIFAVNHHHKRIDLALLIARISIALLMLTHGLPKMDKFSEETVQFIDFLGVGASISLGLAIFAEVFCSILILLGLGTRLAVIPLSITMLVVVFHVQSGDFSKQELGFHFLLVYVLLLIMGSGKYSLDSLIFKKRNKRLKGFNRVAPYS